MLPAELTDALFARMEAMWGTRLADLWRGTNPEAVKALWTRTLAPFADQPAVIRDVLAALFNMRYPPDLPAILPVFKESALRHQTDRPRLEHKPTPEEQARAERIRREVASTVRPEARAPKGWAYALQRRHQAGEPLKLCQIQAYREALGIDESTTIEVTV